MQAADAASHAEWRKEQRLAFELRPSRPFLAGAHVFISPCGGPPRVESPAAATTHAHTRHHAFLILGIGRGKSEVWTNQETTAAAEEAAEDAEEAEDGVGVEVEEAGAAVTAEAAEGAEAIAETAVPSVTARSRTMVVSPTSVRSSLLAARTAMLP